MANHISHAALPYPVKNARFTIRVPFRVAAGTPTDPTTPDTEFSTDGGATFADCAEEITTGGLNGLGFITLSGAETNAGAVDIAAKSANCLTTLMLVSPRVLPILESGTAQAGAVGTLTLASGAAAYDLAGCIVRTTGGTGGGGVGGANNQARVITAYNTSTKVATVVPNWETTPDGTTTYDVLLTEMACNTVVTRGLRPTTDGRTLDVSTGGEAGIDWANVGTAGSTVNLSATTVNLVNTLTTYTGNTVQTGDSFVRIGAAGAGLTALGDTRIANLDAAVSSRFSSSTMPESYAADGATMTPAQAFYQIWSAIAEFSISSTTITGKKLDGITTAMTFTLDSDTAPTSRTRAT